MFAAIFRSRAVLPGAFAFALMGDPVSSVAYAIEAALRALQGDLQPRSGRGGRSCHSARCHVRHADTADERARDQRRDVLVHRATRRARFIPLLATPIGNHQLKRPLKSRQGALIAQAPALLYGPDRSR